MSVARGSEASEHRSLEIPVIDLGPARGDSIDGRRAVAEAIDRACVRSGFLVVVDHGVSPAVVDGMYAETWGFFGRSQAWKERHAADPRDVVRRGFHGIASSVAASRGIVTAPDLCESYSMNRLGEPEAADAAGLQALDPLARPNHWPRDLPGFRDAWLAYLAAMERLATELLGLFALALGLPRRWFADKTDRHMTNLSANYYPGQAHPPPPGQLRKGPHSDWGSLTILHQAGGGGLQIQARDGSWTDVPVIADSFVVNVGDLMAIWTNDRWVSTVHRVVNPVGDAARRPRLSIAFFHQPNHDSLIECIPTCTSADRPPRHAPVTSGAWLADKIRLANQQPAQR